MLKNLNTHFRTPTMASLFFVFLPFIIYLFSLHVVLWFSLYKTLTLRTLIKLLQQSCGDTSLVLKLFSDEDGAFNIETEISFYEFMHVCGNFTLHQQLQLYKQQESSSQLSQLTQLQQQQQQLFQTLSGNNKQPLFNQELIPESAELPFTENLILCINNS